MKMIDKTEIVHVNGIYTSVLYSDWHAVEYLVQRDGHMFRIRMPYKTRMAANQTLDYLMGRSHTHPRPDYRPIIHMMEQGRAK